MWLKTEEMGGQTSLESCNKQKEIPAPGEIRLCLATTGVTSSHDGHGLHNTPTMKRPWIPMELHFLQSQWKQEDQSEDRAFLICPFIDVKY